jgi:aryl-alcohol dehydrogenase-like predicted oxidoreductase
VDEEYLYGVVDALSEVAEETGRSIPQVALNWLLNRPSVATIIIGARNEEQLRNNIGAVGWKLTPSQLEKLAKASERPLPYPVWHQAFFQDRNPRPVS